MGPKKLVGKKMGKKVPAKGRALTRQKKKPLLLEVGKTYETESGAIQVRIIDLNFTRSSSWAAAGELVKGDMRSFGRHWYENGLYHALDYQSREGWLDLVREVPEPKAPARKASRKGAAK